MKYTSTFNAICLLFFCSVANAATCSNVADALSTRPFELSITDSTLKACQGVSANTADAFFNAMQTSTLNAIFSGTDTTKNGIEINAGFNSLLLKISFKAYRYTQVPLALSFPFRSNFQQDTNELG